MGTSQKPFQVSKTSLQKLLCKAYNLSKELPTDYPTVEDIDDLLESEEYNDPQIQEDTFKCFVLCLMYGFTRDKAWHEAHPKHRHITVPNMMQYIFTPLTGKESLELHTNVWGGDASIEEQEDRQAAFEYMQSIIMDTSLYVVVDDIEKSGSGKKTKKKKGTMETEENALGKF